MGGSQHSRAPEQCEEKLFFTRSFCRPGWIFKSHGHCVKVYGSWVKVKVKGMAGELSSCDGDCPL